MKSGQTGAEEDRSREERIMDVLPRGESGRGKKKGCVSRVDSTETESNCGGQGRCRHIIN